MTKQETFDMVVRHARAQPFRCNDEDGWCVYRRSDGARCWVGALIPDDMYTPAIEGNGVGANCGPDGLLVELGHDVCLAGLLQEIHDSYPPESWPSKLRSLAIRHKLSTAVLDECFPESAQ